MARFTVTQGVEFIFQIDAPSISEARDRAAEYRNGKTISDFLDDATDMFVLDATVEENENPSAAPARTSDDPMRDADERRAFADDAAERDELKALAQDARATSESDWGTSRQIDADNLFFERLEAWLQARDLDAWESLVNYNNGKPTPEFKQHHINGLFR